MHVTPDVSYVETNILGAATQPLGAEMEILYAVMQLMALRRAAVHQEGNSWCTVAHTIVPPLQYPILFISSLEFSYDSDWNR